MHPWLLCNIAFNIGTELNPTLLQRRDCLSQVEDSVKHVAIKLQMPQIILMDASKTLSMVMFKPGILLWNVSENGRVNNAVQHRSVGVMWALNGIITSCRVCLDASGFSLPPPKPQPETRDPQITSNQNAPKQSNEPDEAAAEKLWVLSKVSGWPKVIVDPHFRIFCLVTVMTFCNKCKV